MIDSAFSLAGALTDLKDNGTVMCIQGKHKAREVYLNAWIVISVNHESGERRSQSSPVPVLSKDYFLLCFPLFLASELETFWFSLLSLLLMRK